MKYKRLFFILAIAVIVLAIPLIAMQFTTEANWTFTGFLIMGFYTTGNRIGY